jgi:hypothetical protein
MSDSPRATPIRLLLGIVLVLFSVYTGWIAVEFGYTSVFEVAFREHPTTQAVVDLWIACGLLFFVMILDNQRSGGTLYSVAPYAVLTLLLGAIGPLLYFLVQPNLLTPRGVVKP